MNQAKKEMQFYEEKFTLRSKIDSLAYKYHHEDSEEGLSLE